MSKPDNSTLTGSQLATVRRQSDRLLQEASAYGVFPTPVDRLLAAAKLTVVEDEVLDEPALRRFLARAKAGMAVALKSALSKVLGLFDAQERLVVLDRDVPKPRRPFVKLHEAGHGTLPHQSKVYALIHDCEKTLDPDISDLFEREANVFASETLFQGDLFSKEAHDQAFGIKVPMGLARKFGASNYATFRRYIGTSPRACGLVVLEQAVLTDDLNFIAEVRRIVVSRTFHAIYDARRIGPVIDSTHPLAWAVPVGKRMVYPRDVSLTDRNGDQRECIAEAFNTMHHILLLILDKKPFVRKSIILPSITDIIAVFKKE